MFLLEFLVVLTWFQYFFELTLVGHKITWLLTSKQSGVR